jgi:hypothetical protein
MSFQADIDLSAYCATHAADAMSLIKQRQDFHDARSASRARSVALSPELAFMLGNPLEVWGMSVVVREAEEID